MKLIYGLIGVICVAPYAYLFAQEMPLWRLENHQKPQDIPAYGGGLSPFALSAPQTVVKAAAGEDADELARAAQRETLLKQAQDLTKPQRALMPRLVSAAKALTNGGKGLRVLVGGDWLGVGDTLPVRYDVRPETRNALIELQRVDETAARDLANRLERITQTYNEQPNTLKSIDAQRREILLSGAMGDIVIPLKIMDE